MSRQFVYPGLYCLLSLATSDMMVIGTTCNKQELFFVKRALYADACRFGLAPKELPY
jgi:hypothetical protein